MHLPRVEEILDQLIDLPTGERSAELEALCAGDPQLRDEVASLLAAFEQSGAFLRPAANRRLRPADRIGRYRILAEIGRGAMGIVHLAEDPRLGRRVAIKTLSSLAPNSLRRLGDEARMLAAVSQPNVAQVYSFEEVSLEPGDESSGAPSVDAFLTMEYVPGTTLAERLRGGPLPVENALEILRQIAAGLEAAHDAGIVHRDLKPQNIRITPGGWVKVLDFGIAFAPERDPGRASRPCGTAGYMSPEQAAGAEVDRPSDLWSLGRILHECLTGSLPPGSEEGDPLPESIHAPIRRLARELCAPEPADRPTATATRRVLEEELLRLRARALFAPSDGPPTADGPPAPSRGNLPRRLSTFIGRRRVLNEAADLVPLHRLVTLTGPGGSGKTRLALELAARLSPGYPDGVWFVDLSTIEAGSEVGATAAHALGVRDGPGGAGADAEESTARAFAALTSLVVLDNCEHVLDEAHAWVSRMLDRCPGLTLLATSRAPIGVEHEQIYAVPPLRLPDPADDPARCRESEAVQLFEARARSRDASFRASDAQVAAIAAICRRADGLPLAIEIAAGHTRSLSIPEILSRFESNPLSLGSPSRRLPSRHRSLAGTVQWSYRLLGRPERLLFERLSLFRGGWTLEAAEAIAARDGLAGWQLCDLLARLVERSLVEVDHLGAAGAARYRLLETILRFAADRLSRRENEPRATEDRYIDYFRDFLHPRAGETPGGAEWLSRVDAERANLNQALSLSLRAGRTGTAFTLAARLTRYWTTAGLWREGSASLEKVLRARASEVPGREPEHGDGSLPAVHVGPGAAPSQADAIGGRAPATRDGVSGETAPERVDPRDEAAVLGCSARLAALVDDRETALLRSERAVEVARGTGSARSLARALVDAGATDWYAVRLDPAESRFREALALFDQAGDRAGVAVCLGNLAAIHGGRLEYAEALGLYERQLGITRELGDRLATGKALFSLGRMLDRLGRSDESLAPLLESLEIHRETRDVPGIALCLFNLGETYLSLERLGEAEAHLVEALRLRVQLGNPYGICSVLIALARCARAAGDDEPVAEILGSVGRAVEERDVPMLDVQRTMLADLLRDTKERLGATRFDPAQARGASRSLEEAAEWAMERGRT